MLNKVRWRSAGSRERKKSCTLHSCFFASRKKKLNWKAAMSKVQLFRLISSSESNESVTPRGLHSRNCAIFIRKSFNGTIAGLAALDESKDFRRGYTRFVAIRTVSADSVLSVPCRAKAKEKATNSSVYLSGKMAHDLNLMMQYHSTDLRKIDRKWNVQNHFPFHLQTHR